METTGYEIQTEGVMFALPSRILTRTMDTAALLDIAKTKRALDPTIFDETPPFFLSCEMSNKNLDSYYTEMDESSLRNFADDASAGIGFQDSHSSNMGLGISLTGTFDGQRTIADFLIQRSIKFGGKGSYATSDDFINQVRGGTAKDVSVGFYFKNTDPNLFAGVRCQICGENLYRWDCPHVPGLTYDETSDGGQITRVICKGLVLNARAAETSCAYEGATPDAAILKAQAEASLGRLTPKEARFLEDRYRNQNLKLADVRQIYALGSMTQERTMADKTKTDEQPVRHPDDVAMFNTIRTALTKAGFAENQDAVAAITAMTDELGTLRKLKDDQPALVAQAADGALYRKSRQDRAWAEYVRFSAAKGITLAADAEAAKRAVWERMSIADIDAMADGYEEYSNAKLGGGRQTVDDNEEKRTVPTFSEVPSIVYQ